jgi:RNA-directed DNA polymerase
MERSKHCHAGGSINRFVRYADDFVVTVSGSREDAEALRDEVTSVLAPMGLRLSEEKTKVCHIDEGFDFLGFRIQRGTDKRRVYSYPSKRSLASVAEGVQLSIEEVVGLGD